MGVLVFLCYGYCWFGLVMGAYVYCFRFCICVVRLLWFVGLYGFVRDVWSTCLVDFCLNVSIGLVGGCLLLVCVLVLSYILTYFLIILDYYFGCLLGLNRCCGCGAWCVWCLDLLVAFCWCCLVARSGFDVAVLGLGASVVWGLRLLVWL